MARRVAVACAMCYGGGLALYAARWPGRQAKYWGYHEWMHVLITVSFYCNVRGVQHTAASCPAP